MTNLTNTIEELRNQVVTADTSIASGRQVVADNCYKLYCIIEAELLAQYDQDSIDDAYNDLCNGDFAAPYMCELKKSKFELYYRIYTQNVLA